MAKMRDALRPIENGPDVQIVEFVERFG